MMSATSQIDHKIRNLIAATLCTNEQVVTGDTSMADLGADSLDIVALVLAIEDEFNLDIHDEDAAQLDTVKELVEYVSFASERRPGPA